MQMLRSQTAEEFKAAVTSASDWLADMGYCVPALDVSQSTKVVLAILEHELFTK